MHDIRPCRPPSLPRWSRVHHAAPVSCPHLVWSTPCISPRFYSQSPRFCYLPCLVPALGCQTCGVTERLYLILKFFVLEQDGISCTGVLTLRICNLRVLRILTIILIVFSTPPPACMTVTLATLPLDVVLCISAFLSEPLDFLSLSQVCDLLLLGSCICKTDIHVLLSCALRLAAPRSLHLKPGYHIGPDSCQ